MVSKKEKYDMSKTPPQVRILPMNFLDEFEDEYKTVDGVQKRFFRKEKFRSLKEKAEGEYWYRGSGLKAPTGAIVLFQCDGEIIGCAQVMRKQRKFPRPKRFADGSRYMGTLFFKPESIRIFRPRIDERIIRMVWPRFRRFNQTKQHLKPPAEYSRFERILRQEGVRIL
jgi:hypothetical protein